MGKYEDNQKAYENFNKLVNMTASELDEWLDTEDSKNSGREMDNGETVGHQSGRQIVKILNKNKDDLTDANYDHMREVIGYINRHKAQGPEKDIENSTWRYSLMNWGHDPCKQKK